MGGPRLRMKRGMFHAVIALNSPFIGGLTLSTESAASPSPAQGFDQQDTSQIQLSLQTRGLTLGPQHGALRIQHFVVGDEA